MQIQLSSLFLLFSIAVRAHAQTPSSVPHAPDPPLTAFLAFDTAQNTSLGGKGTVMTGLTACSPDGVAFFLMLDNTDSQDLVLHSINSRGESSVFVPSEVRGYKNVGSPTRFFVSSRYVAVLTNAQKDTGLVSPPDETYYPLALVYKRDGTLQTIIPVPQGFEANGVGVYDSGDILLIGMGADQIGTAADHKTMIRIFSPDGTAIRAFSLFDEDFNKTTGSSTKQPLRDFLPSGALEFVQLAAYGQNLLVIPSATSEPILQLNESGVVRKVSVELPRGMTLDSALDVTGIPWLIKTYSRVDKNPPSMYPGPIVAVNPGSGEVERIIAVPNTSHTRVACESQGNYLGLTTDPKSGRLEIQEGVVAGPPTSPL